MNDGSQEIVAQLTRLAAGLAGDIPTAAGQAWSNQDCVPLARQIVPIDTGATRDSIEGAAGPGGVTISAGTDYAADIEFGTSKVAARPFIAPAIRNTLAALSQKFKLEIEKRR